MSEQEQRRRSAILATLSFDALATVRTLRAELESVADFDRVEVGLDAKIETIKKELKLV